MNFRSHIPKPQLPQWILRFVLCLFIIGYIITPMDVYAESEAELTNSAVDSILTSYNGTSDSNRGGNSAIPNGVSYTRTGYLCYLLTKDGATTGDPAYAFASPGFSAISGSKWVCTSRRGQSVSGWSGEAFWGVTPWCNGGSPSNEPQIRDWFLKPTSDGTPQALQFVQDCWGEKAARSFQSDEYILVIETIMNFQYSIAGGSGSGSGSAGIPRQVLNQISKDATKQAIAIVEKLNIQGSSQAAVIQGIARTIYNRVVSSLQKSGYSGGNRTFTSDPLIGTVPNLIQYKNGSKVFDSYTNKVAPHAEKIRVSEAGFTAYPSSGPNQLTDSEVQSYGVAMLIIHCKNDAIHTYWEPNGSPGNPEPRLPGKTGTCNIVKGYYKENLTTGAKESLGVYSELDVTSNIIVSSEPDFELVEYLCL